MFAHGWEITLNLASAWAAASLIGVERSYNGRAAGFRTHALVGLAAASAMIVSFQPLVLSSAFPPGALRMDPTRIVQGVLAGIGFLGAGVIFKEGVNVQGLTSAAGIWATAVIGMLFGLGLFYAGVFSTVATLITLVTFRWLEAVMAAHVYAMAVFRFHAEAVPREQTLHDLLGEHDVKLRDMSYRLCEGGDIFEYHGVLRTRRSDSLRSLAARLRQLPGLTGYDLDRISK
jgi:putative Mg2+ transporter-C (MgtC) family protein